MSKTILAISGSVRHESFTTKTLKAFQKYAPTEVEIKIAKIDDFPIFNQDNESPEPEFLVNFKQQILAADGILFLTPEYNRSVPALLKNAIDWASRPWGTSAWNNKPAFVAGISPSNLGASGAVRVLRQSLAFLNMPTVDQPEFFMTMAAEKFNESGELTDEHTIEKIREVWEKFSSWVDLFTQK